MGAPYRSARLLGTRRQEYSLQIERTPSCPVRCWDPLRGVHSVMARRDIIVVGASAGGVEALGGLVRQLPADLGAAVLVVLHLAAEQKSVLPRILSSAGVLPARHARDGESIVPDRIYVARADHHLVVHEDRIRVVRGPRENGHRPAI